MQQSKTENTRPGFAAILGAALLTGLFAGALFGVRETFRVCLTARRYSWMPSSLGYILDVGGYAVSLYAAVGAGFTAFLGLLVWVAVRVRRLRAGRAAIVALAVAGLAFVLLFLALWDVMSHPDPQRMFISEAAKMAFNLELGAVSLLAAGGLAGLVYLAARRFEHWAALLSAAAAVVCTAFLAVVWSTWLIAAAYNTQITVPALGSAALVLLAAAAVGLGVYAALPWLLRPAIRGSRRRLVLGAALMAAGAAGLAIITAATAPKQPDTQRAAQPSPPEGTRKRPNVILLVMDTARADALSCYGHERETTPNLDAIAEESTLYERCLANAPWTLPSHASLFTGLLPSEHAATGENVYLDDRFLTIAEVLRQHGYRTFARSANAFVGRHTNLDQGFEDFRAIPYGRRPERLLLLRLISEKLRWEDYGAAHQNAEALRWIEERHARNEPFFAFINYMEPHHHYGATPGFSRWFDSTAELRKALAVPQYVNYYLVPGRGSRKSFARLRKLYDGDVTYLDAQIGAFVARLKALGVLENTLLIIASDHGEELGDHGVLAHRFWMFDTLLHVPLIVRYPSAFAAGRRESRLVQLLDIVPTILNVLEIPWDGHYSLRGRSLLTPPADGHYSIAENFLPLDAFRYTHAQLGPWPGQCIMERLKSIQNPFAKYVWSSAGNDQYYHLEADPDEQENLIGTRPEEAQTLKAKLENALGKPLQRLDAPPRPSVVPEAR